MRSPGIEEQLKARYVTHTAAISPPKTKDRTRTRPWVLQRLRKTGHEVVDNSSTYQNYSPNNALQ